ncbi:tetratricopeptide repeat protein [Tepidimonas charontis]|uniref:Beta-barrel assembly-enhancing protease n=1 Tax=Tepidimonas charontis TaxID=2267262 RepID=A0A554XEL2_9BURK|nr:tetratricopeptide repeat protein [Tepidimonas charontis]TSE34272.1 Beta-barrel assembly-enhancing protease [Tepidimonas charontis]
MNATRSVAWALWRARWFIWWRREARALAVVEGALARHPDEPQLLAFRAHLLAELQRPREALGVLDRLVHVAPHQAAHWFNRGYLQEQLGCLDAAEASFRQALAHDEKLDRAWYGLGLVLIRLGRLDEALQALRRNTELQPMSPYAWYQMARIHADRAESDEAARIIAHLKGFEPRIAAQLERETGLRTARTA